MKKLILLFLLCTSWVSAFSQKIVKDEKDQFTGIHIVETNYTAISDGFNCALRTLDGTTALLVSFNGGNNIYTMEKGADFMFKLQNDDIITVHNLKYSIAEYWSTKIGNSLISHYTLKTEYVLLEDQINQLKTTPITVVRFYTTDGFIERKVSAKNAKKLLNLFNLIK